MNLAIFAILLVSVAGLGIAAWSLLPIFRNPHLLAARLSAFTAVGATGGFTNVDQEILAQPLSERLLRPLSNTVGAFLIKRTPASQLATLEADIAAAGLSGKHSAATYASAQYLLALFGLAGGLVLANSLGLSTSLFVVVAAAGVVIGYLMPRTLLRRAIRSRQEEISDAMPNALDLLTISVEAGQAFDAALLRVTEKYNNALSDEFAKVLFEMKLGSSRREALTALTERTRVEDLETFVHAILQSEQLGSSIAMTLRVQSEDMRRRRRQLAEEQGQKAPVKMLFPMVGCIFPTLGIVLLGPALITLSQSLLH